MTRGVIHSELNTPFYHMIRLGEHLPCVDRTVHFLVTWLILRLNFSLEEIVGRKLYLSFDSGGSKWSQDK